MTRVRILCRYFPYRGNPINIMMLFIIGQFAQRQISLLKVCLTGRGTGNVPSKTNQMGPIQGWVGGNNTPTCKHLLVTTNLVILGGQGRSLCHQNYLTCPIFLLNILLQSYDLSACIVQVH